MNAEEIDNIFDALKSDEFDDYKYLWEVSQMPYIFSEENADKYKEELHKRLGKIIEQGDFEYFLTKKNGELIDKKNFVTLLSYTSKIDEIKKCIEDRERLELLGGDVTKLIIGTKDVNYIKDCIENRSEELDLNSYNLAELIVETKDINYIKNCIEDRRDVLNLNSDDVTVLIIGTNDLEYIQDCIENRRSELDLDIFDIINLIIGTKDSDYIKDCIENKIEELDLDAEDITNLIEGTKDIDYIKECIECKRQKFMLGSYNITSLIKATKDIDYIKDCIESKRQEFELESYDIRDLIIETKDANYIKDCIDNNRQKFMLASYIITSLIKETKDIDYIKECIESKRQEFELESCDIRDLIIETKDTNYIKDCINNNRQKFKLRSCDIRELIVKTEDTDYIKNCIDNRRKELKLSDREIRILLGKIDDQNYIRDCIYNRREELGISIFDIKNFIRKIENSQYLKDFIDDRERLALWESDIVYLIEKIADEEYTKECINKKEELMLESSSILELIKTVNQPNYIKECITNKESLDLNDEQVLELITMNKDDNAAKECIIEAEKVKINNSYTEILKIIYDKENEDNLLKIDDNAVINLPSEMTIGIEIETVGQNTESLRNLLNKFFENWKCKKDGSLMPDRSREYGIEVVSPILKGSNKTNVKDILKICAILQNLGMYTNNTCGGHIHIGANYLDNVDAWKNLLELWTNTEQILYIIGNKKGDIPREGTIKYASPISKALEEELNYGSINLQDESDLEKFKKQILTFQAKDRYKGINFKNIKNRGKNTIEFRLPNGTIDANVWIQNINLFGGIVKAAQELSIIQSKEESKISEEEKKKLICFESIKSDDLDENEKLELLLELVIEESERSIYTERYRTNKELLDSEPFIRRGIKSKILKKPLKISKNKIGKRVLTGNERVMEQDMEVTEQYIGRNLEQQNYKCNGEK